MYDVLIIGGGPAGLTAAVYALRAGKSVLVLEKAAFGGQITWSPKVENFPGSVSLTGNEIGDMLLNQALEQGAEVELEEIEKIEKTPSGFKAISAGGAVFEGKALISALGAKPRMMGIEKENELIGNGVCFCAVCDGAFYSGKDVAVYGGGNSALQDALLLSETCSKVYLIHRRDSFRGEAKLTEALKSKANVEFILNATITGLSGESELTGVEINQAGEVRSLPVEGLFVAIGHAPDNSIISEFAALDKSGYADSDESCLTKTPGLFAAGDCRRKSVRQVATACSDGAVAALGACSYIDSL